MNNRDYSVNELIHDEAFRRVVKGTASPSEIDQWNLWMEENEQNRIKAKEAISEIAGFKFKDPNGFDVEEEWNCLYNFTVGKIETKLPYRPNRGSSLQWIFRVVAVIILGAIVGMGIYTYSESEQATNQLEQITHERTIETGDNEQKTVRFSHGSRIVLNNNSTLTYTIGLLHNQTIDVVLEGEAFFDAKSDPEQNKPVFTVRTPDGVIRDIGTQFLVTVREDYSRVVLQEGVVEVNTKKQQNPDEKIAIQKGEMLEFDELKIIKRATVNSTFYTAWATGSMQFDNTTIKEFAGFVENRFDVNVQIVDPQSADIKVDGGVYFKSLRELVRSVSDVAKIPVYQSEDRKTVYIGNFNP